MREERGEGKENKNNNKTFTIYVHMLSFLRLYCWLMPNILTFRTPIMSGFLVYGVPNAKYLAFDTPNGNALKKPHCYLLPKSLATAWAEFSPTHLILKVVSNMSGSNWITKFYLSLMWQEKRRRRKTVYSIHLLLKSFHQILGRNLGSGETVGE